MNLKLILFLFFSICFSKEVLVFNEELLIVFSFLVFIFLVYNLLSKQISLELDFRADKIKQEFNFYTKAQKETLKYLIQYYSKQKELALDIEKLFFILRKDTYLIIELYSHLIFKLLSFIIEDKLKKILSIELKFNILVQNYIISLLCSHLFLYFSNKRKRLARFFIKKSILSLRKII
jgi:hypothetical protein